MGENETPEPSEQPSKKQFVSFRYYKSNFFRVIHADGAWGGVSPRGNIHISFYNERGALPDSGRVEVSSEGAPLKPEQYHSSSRVVRELEVDVVMDLTTARTIHAWLGQKIGMLQALVEDAQEEAQKAHNESAQQKAVRHNGEKVAREG